MAEIGGVYVDFMIPVKSCIVWLGSAGHFDGHQQSPGVRCPGNHPASADPGHSHLIRPVNPNGPLEAPNINLRIQPEREESVFEVGPCTSHIIDWNWASVYD